MVWMSICARGLQVQDGMASPIARGEIRIGVAQKKTIIFGRLRARVLSNVVIFDHLWGMSSRPRNRWTRNLFPGGHSRSSTITTPGLVFINEQSRPSSPIAFTSTLKYQRIVSAGDETPTSSSHCSTLPTQPLLLDLSLLEPPNEGLIEALLF